MDIVTRPEWGAPARSGGDYLPLSRVERLFVHYSGMAADFEANHDRCYDRVLGIYRYHTSPDPDDPTKPWADIAYSWVGCIHGALFEGRGLGKRTAATGPCNDDSYAYCFLGNDREGRRDFTPEARASLAWLIADLERRKGSRLGVNGHRDCMSTSCPGDELYALIRNGDIRDEEDDMATPKETWGWQVPASEDSPEQAAWKHLRYQSDQLRSLQARVSELTALVKELEQPAQVSAEAIADELAARLSA